MSVTSSVNETESAILKEHFWSKYLLPDHFNMAMYIDRDVSSFKCPASVDTQAKAISRDRGLRFCLFPCEGSAFYVPPKHTSMA